MNNANAGLVLLTRETGELNEMCEVLSEIVSLSDLPAAAGHRS
jgi:hypothetical protein